MLKYHFIEDYIMDMGATFLTWPPKQSQIKLARYDETIVQNMSDQVNRGLAFTDKQAELAVKLVTKYRKQWFKLGYDISDQIEKPKFKYPIRQIDRSKSIEIDENKICLKFPYHQELISEIRSSHDIPGTIYFDKENKHWKAATTEPRILWCANFAIKHDFQIGKNFCNHLDNLHNKKFNIPLLTEVDNNLVLEHAADSLIEYIETNGGINYKNIFTLFDLSGLCGYKIDHNLVEKYIGDDPNLFGILTSKNKNIEYRDSVPIDSIIKYIKMTKIKVVSIYDDNTLKIYDKLNQHFDNKMDDKLDILCYNSFSKANKKVDLLLTSHTYMIGHRRQLMCQLANKIINFTHVID